MADSNTRTEKRAPITLKIKFKSDNVEQFTEKYSADLSRSGIFVRTKEPLDVGTTLRFEFQLKDGVALLTGEGSVAWTRAPDPARPNVAAGMGVRFDQLDGQSQATLDKILADKAKLGAARGAHVTPGFSLRAGADVFSDDTTRAVNLGELAAMGQDARPRAGTDPSFREQPTRAVPMAELAAHLPNAVSTVDPIAEVRFTRPRAATDPSLRDEPTRMVPVSSLMGGETRPARSTDPSYREQPTRTVALSELAAAHQRVAGLGELESTVTANLSMFDAQTAMAPALRADDTLADEIDEDALPQVATRVASVEALEAAARLSARAGTPLPIPTPIGARAATLDDEPSEFAAPTKPGARAIQATPVATAPAATPPLAPAATPPLAPAATRAQKVATTHAQSRVAPPPPSRGHEGRAISGTIDSDDEFDGPTATLSNQVLSQLAAEPSEPPPIVHPEERRELPLSAAVTDDTPPPAEPVSRAQPARIQTVLTHERRPPVAALALVGLAAVATVGIWFTLLRNEQPRPTAVAQTAPDPLPPHAASATTAPEPTTPPPAAPSNPEKPAIKEIALVLSSSTPGVRFRLEDGREGTSPWTLKTNAYQDLRVTQQAPGHVTQTETLPSSRLQQLAANGKVALAPLTAKHYVVRVSSSPAGAAIMLGGVATGKLTPADIALPKAPVGPLELVIKKAGHETAKRTVELMAFADAENAVATLEVDLPATQATPTAKPNKPAVASRERPPALTSTTAPPSSTSPEPATAPDAPVANKPAAAPGPTKPDEPLKTPSTKPDEPLKTPPTKPDEPLKTPPTKPDEPPKAPPTKLDEPPKAPPTKPDAPQPPASNEPNPDWVLK